MALKNMHTSLSLSLSPRCLTTFIMGAAAKTAVPTFHYSSTMEGFQRAPAYLGNSLCARRHSAAASAPAKR